MTTHTTEHPGGFDYLNHYNQHIQIYLWLCLLLPLFVFATVTNAFFKILSYRRRALVARYIGTNSSLPKGCSRTGKTCTRWVPSAFLAFWRKYSVRKNRFVSERLFVGSFGQVGLITFYVGINMALTFIGAYGDIDWQAHHAARLVFANLPLTIGLASKNNVISYMTGFSYESLNVLHRWSARMILILSYIHVGGRVYVNVPSTDPSFSLAGQAYVRWGIMALVAMTWMILVASRLFRNYLYQLFIIQHVSLFLISMVGLWLHRPAVAPWIWVGLIIWGFDRIVRTFRIVWRHTFVKAGQMEDGDEMDENQKTALVEILNADTLRVTVKTTMCWIPGQHVYLHVPFLSAGGHPFSIASIPRPLTQSDNSRPKEAKQQMIIRVRKGVTRRLYELTEKEGFSDPEKALGVDPASPPNPLASSSISLPERGSLRFRSKRIYAWTEGPYGNLQHLDEHQTLLLIAGGSGVSFTLPIMLDIVRRAKGAQVGDKRIAVATERLTFVWVIREEDHISWIGETLREAIEIAPVGFLSVQIFVTRMKTRPDQSTGLGLVRPLSSVTVIRTEEGADAQREKVKEEFTSPLPEIPDVLVSPLVSKGQAPNLGTASLPNLPPPASVPPTPTPPRPSPLARNLTTGCQPVSCNPCDASNVSNSPHPPISIHAGRPNLSSILETEIGATPYTDWVGVGVCGPAGMGREMAEVVYGAIEPWRVLRGEHRRNVCLIQEEYGW